MLLIDTLRNITFLGLDIDRDVGEPLKLRVLTLQCFIIPS